MAIVIMLVLSASMSTLSSLVISSASTMTVDFVKGFIKKDMKDSQQMVYTRIFCVVFVAVSLTLALFPGTLITNLMAISWGALSGAFLAPFMYGLYSKKITNASVWAGFIVGIGFIVVNMFVGLMPGTSAGAVFGCNYKSKQIGRTIRYNKKYCRNRKCAFCRRRLVLF